MLQLSPLFKKIPPSRLLAYLLGVCLLPPLFAICLFFTKLHEIERVENLLTLAQEAHLLKEKKTKENQQIIATYKDADHFYIDKYLEALTFLEKEVEQLTTLVEGDIPVTGEIHRRYEKLTSPDNQLHFVEGQVLATKEFQETLETLTRPIELSLEDLLQLLVRIEGVQIGTLTPPPKRPHLLITDCTLEKKQPKEGYDVFSMQLKVLKREYL